MTCDKLAAKTYAAERGIQPPITVWHGTNLDELRSVDLPPHWVLKPNHRTGLVYFGHGGADIADIRRATRGWLEERLWAVEGEWAYRDAKRCFVIEELIGEPYGDLPDYKFFAFDGRVEMVQVDSQRFSGHLRRLYTRAWEPLDVQFKYPLGEIQSRPDCYEEMLSAAAKLGAGFDMIRVDLYEYEGKMYFGELTPYPDSGRGRFIPHRLDVKLGEYWQLPSATR
ncbi:ATP-grasp fold amidoligase family protein [Mycobacterium sp. C3-094]